MRRFFFRNIKIYIDESWTFDNLFSPFMFVEQNILYSASDNQSNNFHDFFAEISRRLGRVEMHQIGQKLARFSTPFTVKRRKRRRRKSFLMLQHSIQVQFLTLISQSPTMMIENLSKLNHKRNHKSI